MTHEEKLVRQRKRRAARAANGLCPHCGRPNVPGLKTCETHRRALLEASHRYVERRRVADANPGNPRPWAVHPAIRPS